jgi:adenine-specific DNA-methyltransferase
MAAYFGTVLLPRIKKVTFTPEWKDSKPKRMATAETFNYLLGLDVQTRRVYPGDAGVSPAHYLLYQGTLRNGRTVAVIWCDVTGWKIEDYEREAAFVAEQKLTAGADEIYVNGDSRIPGARALDPLFKERMCAGVES